MKRSILFGLAGFGLASMLFALVAFVGVDATNKSLVYIRIEDSYLPANNSVISIAYPDGRLEFVDLQIGDRKYGKVGYNVNMPTITKTFNKINAQGYEMKSHTSQYTGSGFVETFIFEKN